MKLNSAFGLAKFSPGKEAQTKVYGSGIEAEQFILEAKFPFLSGILVAKQVTQMKENVLIKLPGSMGIRIGKCTLGKSASRQSQMIELATSDIQAISDLPQALGLSQLAKQHSNELVPRGESLGMAFRPAFVDQPHKRRPGHDLEDLTK
jgi:hypothetical protein